MRCLLIGCWMHIREQRGQLLLVFKVRVIVADTKDAIGPLPIIARTILSTSIRQDAEGRYCLNDCWKASGAENSKRPSLWEANVQTSALINELQGSAGIPAHPTKTVKTGANERRGIWACKELVYAYAMWISPAFHLQVIRAFDALVTGQLALANNKSVAVADMEKQVRAAVGGIMKGVVNKALEPHLTYAKLLEAKIDALTAKTDQALVLMDRPAPAPSTVVAPHQGQIWASQDDENRILRTLKDLGGKATMRDLARKLQFLAPRRDAALNSLVESGVIAIERGVKSTPHGGRPFGGIVRLIQVPFAQTPA
nr:KilA-N domain-containing protein [Acetobacter malorum]